jgi:osmotically inducible protein OsmC
MKRKASALWQGDLKTGKGALNTPSGVLSNTQYSFSTRFEEGTGTNPEELIAAAHAGCFSMALSAQLTIAKFPPRSIATSATLTMENRSGAWTVTHMQLDVEASVPEISEAAFQKLAQEAKANCPISKLLNTEIDMLAKLTG